MILFCPNCGYNVETVLRMASDATRYIPADYEECCPECGLTEDKMWEAESYEGEYDEIDNPK